MDLYGLTRGKAPLLISVPHAGTHVPEEIRERLTDKGKELTDTDWHVDRLYRPFTDLGATLITANYSRLVIDLNRPRDGKSLYPGQAVTSLCPVDTFEGEALYAKSEEPGTDEIEDRTKTFYDPYHQAIQEELSRLREMHDHVVLWDGHSIHNRIPRLFDGQLPDFNFGTNDGKACLAGLAERLVKQVKADGRYSVVLNGRFKGGAITRSFGNPGAGISAVQLEMAQDCYMDQGAPFAWREDKAENVREVLRGVLECALLPPGEGGA